jgi:hypothetical protein
MCRCPLRIREFLEAGKFLQPLLNRDILPDGFGIARKFGNFFEGRTLRPVRISSCVQFREDSRQPPQNSGAGTNYRAKTQKPGESIFPTPLAPCRFPPERAPFFFPALWRAGLRAVAKKNLQYSKTNPLFVIPRGAGTQGSVNDGKGRKPGEMGTKPTTSRPWVPACAGMTKKRLSQKGNPFADSVWQTRYNNRPQLRPPHATGTQNSEGPGFSFTEEID